MADDPLDRSRAYVAAGVLFFDDAGRILLVQPTYKDHWDIPGGYVETGETPAQAAAREVREELDIQMGRNRPCHNQIGRPIFKRLAEAL